MAMSQGAGAEGYAFSTADFDWVRRKIKTASGIDLGDGKQDLVYGRMSRRLRALGLSSFKAYRELLDGPDGQRELVEFVNVLTTNVTAFFRERHHFDRLGTEVIAWLRGRGQRVRGWSAGCSSGEEPYSIAMTLLDGLGVERSSWDVRILATDLDTSMVEQGAAGVYPIERLEGVPVPLRQRYFYRGRGRKSGYARVKPPVADLVRFRQLNLMERWPMRGPFDFIFCRNVMIYFDRPTRESLVRRYAERLAPGGYLFIGHSESVEDALDLLVPIGQTTYRRRE